MSQVQSEEQILLNRPILPSKTITLARQLNALAKTGLHKRRTWEYTTALDLYLSQDSTIIWSQRMREKNLIDYHIVIQKNIVDDALVANVLSDLDISKEIEFESEFFATQNIDEQMINAYKISTALKIRTFKKSRLLNASANSNLSKKRKSIINSKNNDESLHSDLQTIIISKFHSINLANEVD
jgi:hypothetical protein